jgi:hypothetical protein
MKKQIKINLEKLSVQSFVTSLDAKSSLTIKGGDVHEPVHSAGVDPYTCVYTRNGCNSNQNSGCNAFTQFCSTDVKYANQVQ